MGGGGGGDEGLTGQAERKRKAGSQEQNTHHITSHHITPFHRTKQKKTVGDRPCNVYILEDALLCSQLRALHSFHGTTNEPDFP